NLNYNYSKNLDLMNSADVFNRKLGKDYSVWDLPHQFRLTFQYVVPKFQSIAGFQNKWLSYALSDWGIGAYLNYQSAPVLARPSSTGPRPTGHFLGGGPGASGGWGAARKLRKAPTGITISPGRVIGPNLTANPPPDRFAITGIASTQPRRLCSTRLHG